MAITLITAGAITLAAYITLNLPPFGSSAKGKRLKKIKASKNYKNGKFENEEHTEMMAGDASYPKMIKKMFEKDPLRQPNKPIPTGISNFEQAIHTDEFKITWFGHSSYLLQVAGKNILVDPVFSERTSPFQFLGTKRFEGTDIIAVRDLPNIDLLLLTHDHYDHLDYELMKQLNSRVKEVITPLGVGAHLERWGFQENLITELDWWESIDIFQECKITSTTARHFSGRGLSNLQSTLWSSYIFESPNHKIFIGGDSGYGSHFKKIGDQYGPFDFTILECGQYNEWWPNIHMFPEQVVQAHLDLKGKVLMPVHWGKYVLAYHAWNESIERLHQAALQSNVTLATPKIGETMHSKNLNSKAWWRAIA
jgi:L-ascorbate metabolism protein UlaG (beta-lactamase superfamily)